jgi:hypothetical protein
MLGILPLAAVVGGDVVGTVTDSASGAPLPSVQVTVQQGTAVVANTSTDPFGRYIIHNIAAGSYTVAAHFTGFLPQSWPLTIASEPLRRPLYTEGRILQRGIHRPTVRR